MKYKKDNSGFNRFDELGDFFKIFGDATRLRILHLLLREELFVNNISEKLSMNQSAVSHQLRILKQARLVKIRREGKNMFYSLDDEHIEMILKLGTEHIMEE
jgi:ArsR family transcriptional regulator